MGSMSIIVMLILFILWKGESQIFNLFNLFNLFIYL